MEQNAMKKNAVLSILIVFLTISFVSLTGCENQYLITDQPAAPEIIQKEDNASQESCNKRCDEYFKKSYLPGYSYRSHFNSRLNKCFLLMEDAAKASKDLYDVDESHHLGMFFRDRDGIYCNLLDAECKSEKEWNSLVKPYMED